MGRFLVQKGALDLRRLKEALRRIKAQQSSLGDLALEKDYLNETQLKELNIKIEEKK